GDAYSFLRDDRFDAANLITGNKDKLNLKDYGWNLGGPNVFHMANADKPKGFFFSGEEYKKLDRQVGFTKVVTVPSLLGRRGDLSQSLRQPIDPATGKPFPGGIIPPEKLSQNGVLLVSKFPLPDANQRTTATLTPTQNRKIREDILKLDATPAGTISLTARYL